MPSAPRKRGGGCRSISAQIRYSLLQAFSRNRSAWHKHRHKHNLCTTIGLAMPSTPRSVRYMMGHGADAAS